MKTAYPTLQSPVKITLYRNVPFDNSYKNHSIISEKFTYNNTKVFEYITGNVPPCEMFLDRCDYTLPSQPYVYPRSVFTGDYNFNFSNGLVASVVMELTPAQTNSNYMKVVSGNDIYYYFITGITQINYETYNLSLELDVLMTYQDEFLEGMKDMPVFTKRKHCHRYTSDGLMPYCADFKTGEDAFAGVKPSIVKEVHKLEYNDSAISNLEGVYWLYICIDNLPNIAGEEYETVNNRFKALSMYKNKNKAYPLTMMCVPINVDSVIYVYKGTPDTEKTFYKDDIIKGIRKLVNDGKVHGAKVSPYPPFNTTYNVQKVGNNIRIIPTSTTVELSTGLGRIYTQTYGQTNVLMGDIDASHSVYTDLGLHGELMFSHGFMIIEQQNACNYIYEDITDELGFSNIQQPTPTSSRYLEPKLLFSPFKKYKISGQYCNEGSEFFPELLFSEIVTSSLLHEYFSFETTATSYIGDNNFYTKVRSDNNDVQLFDNYKYEKIGLASSVNYIFPCGTNALDIFNSTQAQSFYTSKVASGITSGLSIAGGIGSVVLGAGAVAGAPWTGGMSAGAGVGLIAGGATAIASGIAGVATTIASANAKVEDLKNTPDSVNVSGSNFITDECITEDTNGLPYIVVYEVPTIIKENANDYFYSYGYQVARECYFNTELAYNSNYNHLVDNNLFGRTIFNYIQIEDDIVNKINADIPYIAKQKLSSIFNNGITIWNFFGFAELWYSEFTVSYGDYDNDYKPDNWFLKCARDNTEYYGETYTEKEE